MQTVVVLEKDMSFKFLDIQLGAQGKEDICEI
jgi:hypothetical protein